jgi:hypothetical protein
MLDQRELEARVKALNKTVAANEPPANALALIELLKKEDAPTEEMLRVRVWPSRDEGAVPGRAAIHPFAHAPRG